MVDYPGRRCGYQPWIPPARAIRYDIDKRQHVGGPPVALCAYDRAMQCDVGIYLISLKAYDRSEVPWKLAVDFGTSHSLAATEGRDSSSVPVDLSPELALDGGQNPLTLHVSENWPDVPHRELWRPTYLEKRRPGAEALIPSETDVRQVTQASNCIRH